MLELIEIIGKGKERSCFLHPKDPSKVVKVVHIASDKQMVRELRIYHQLEKTSEMSYEYIPKFYGKVETDQGTGYIFDRVKNSDGSESKPLHWFLKNGSNLDEFIPHLEKLRSYLLRHAIIFCNDMSYDGNILVNKASDGSIKLMVIDGLGDVNFIRWSNQIDFFAKRKIKRRWNRLIQRLRSFEEKCKHQSVQ